MRPDASMMPRKVNRRETAIDGRRDEALILVTGGLFEHGWDTREIALQLVRPEAAVAAALTVYRERVRAGEIRA